MICELVQAVVLSNPPNILLETAVVQIRFLAPPPIKLFILPTLLQQPPTTFEFEPVTLLNCPLKIPELPDDECIKLLFPAPMIE